MDLNIKLMSVMLKMNQTFVSSLGKDLEERGIQGSVYAMLMHLIHVKREKTQALGEIALITSGTTTHMVNKMIKEGHVIKVQDESDKRVFWIEITDAGRKFVEDIHVEHIKYLDALLSDFSDEEKEAFIEQIKYFGKTIEKRKVQVKS